MKKSIPKRIIIEICVVLIVIGALLAYEYKVAGLVVVALTLGCYLFLMSRPIVSNIRHIKSLNRNQKIETAIFAVLIYILIVVVASHEVPYFMLIIMLAIEYMMCYKSKNI